MPKMMTRTLRLDDLTSVKRIGAALGAALRAGDVLLLSGDLGAGKTELARAVIQARIGAAIDVPSPTFTLLQTYDAPDLAIVHADLYRIERVADLTELGLDEAMEDCALLVEWPERAMGLWPASRLEVTLSIDGLGPARIAHMTGHGDWAARLDGVLEPALNAQT
jgi:tRNA threonylcarbamoyladenosine biosynthesis protein TsaE